MLVRVTTRTQRAWLALLVKVFSPFSCHREPTFRARVLTAAASEPVSGSVMAMDRMSPPATAGKTARFCSSEPYLISACRVITVVRYPPTGTRW